MNNIKNIALGTVAAATMTAGTVMAEVSGNIGVTSNYMFRGVTLSADEAAISGGLDYAHESGFYAGTWVSNLALDYELDLYAGFSGEAGEIGYDIGYVQYMYPQNTGASAFDYGELYGSVSFSAFTVGLAYTAQSDTDDTAGFEGFIEGDLYYYVSVGGDLGNDWSAGFTAGVYTFEDDGVNGVDADYNHFQVDLTKSAGDMGDFTFSVSVFDDGEGWGFNDQPVPFVSWSKGF